MRGHHKCTLYEEIYELVTLKMVWVTSRNLYIFFYRPPRSVHKEILFFSITQPIQFKLNTQRCYAHVIMVNDYDKIASVLGRRGENQNWFRTRAPSIESTAFYRTPLCLFSSQ